MADYTNAQKLAAILADWARPAIAQVAASRLENFGWVRNLQDGIKNLGIVGNNYSIASDLNPLLKPIINAIVEPMLEAQLSKIPDAAIPHMARNIVNEIGSKGQMTFLDGLIVLEPKDVGELQRLVEMNLPCDKTDGYQVIH